VARFKPRIAVFFASIDSEVIEVICGAVTQASEAAKFLLRIESAATDFKALFKLRDWRKHSVSRQRAPCLQSIVIAASCALLFAIATDELFNGLNSNGEIAVGLCVEGPVLLNISEFPHRSRESSYHTQFILTHSY
jgi:hypothetical protein